MKSISMPPCRYPCVGSPALGTEKRRCENKPRAQFTRRQMTVRRRERSNPENADNGDLGERKFTWKKDLMSNFNAELLSN